MGLACLVQMLTKWTVTNYPTHMFAQSVLTLGRKAIRPLSGSLCAEYLLCIGPFALSANYVWVSVSGGSTVCRVLCIEYLFVRVSVLCAYCVGAPLYIC